MKDSKITEYGDTNENIYSTVPQEHIKQGYEEKRGLILNFLKRSPGIFFKAKAIAIAVEFPTRGTQVEVRKGVTLLIEEDNQPIISNARGFAYVDNPALLIDYGNRLEERKKGLERRITKVYQIAELLKGGTHD
jgi:hypothetical protein